MPAQAQGFNLKELEKTYPAAYAALPEPYKADSCLLFYTVPGVNRGPHIRANYDLGGRFEFRDRRAISLPSLWVKVSDNTEVLPIQ